eukprot:SAG31_NODE_10467_length_1135_cov_1.152510_2_plen_58_part_01
MDWRFDGPDVDFGRESARDTARSRLASDGATGLGQQADVPRGAHGDGHRHHHPLADPW